MLSLAAAVTDTVPLTAAPLAGAVRDAVGGTPSAPGWLTATLMVKSSTFGFPPVSWHRTWYATLLPSVRPVTGVECESAFVFANVVAMALYATPGNVL